MEFNYNELTKKEKKQYDSLDSKSKEIYEKQWCRMKEEMNKLDLTIKRAKEKERKERNHRLIQIGASVESVLQGKIEGKEELELFMEWLRKKEVHNFKKSDV